MEAFINIYTHRCLTNEKRALQYQQIYHSASCYRLAPASPGEGLLGEAVPLMKDQHYRGPPQPATRRLAPPPARSANHATLPVPDTNRRRNTCSFETRGFEPMSCNRPRANFGAPFIAVLLKATALNNGCPSGKALLPRRTVERKYIRILHKVTCFFFPCHMYLLQLPPMHFP